VGKVLGKRPNGKGANGKGRSPGHQRPWPMTQIACCVALDRQSRGTSAPGSRIASGSPALLQVRSIDVGIIDPVNVEHVCDGQKRENHSGNRQISRVFLDFRCHILA
jgi:hypothetical protein